LSADVAEDPQPNEGDFLVGECFDCRTETTVRCVRDRHAPNRETPRLVLRCALCVNGLCSPGDGREVVASINASLNVFAKSRGQDLWAAEGELSRSRGFALEYAVDTIRHVLEPLFKSPDRIDPAVWVLSLSAALDNLQVSANEAIGRRRQGGVL